MRKVCILVTSIVLVVLFLFLWSLCVICDLSITAMIWMGYFSLFFVIIEFLCLIWILNELIELQKNQNENQLERESYHPTEMMKSSIANSLN